MRCERVKNGQIGSLGAGIACWGTKRLNCGTRGTGRRGGLFDRSRGQVRSVHRVAARGWLRIQEAGELFHEIYRHGGPTSVEEFRSKLDGADRITKRASILPHANVAQLVA